MEQHRAPDSICNIKINHLKSCEQCSIKLKKSLQKINGVNDVIIDRKQGMVRVSGNIDPTVFTKLIQNNYKKAEFWSFEKEPSQKIDASSDHNIHIGKDCCCPSDGDESDDHDDINYDDNIPKKQNGHGNILTWQHPSVKDKKIKQYGKGFFGKRENPMGMPPPRFLPPIRPPPPPPPPPQFRPPMNYAGNRYFHGPPRPGYRPIRPPYPPSMTYHRPSPPPPYGYYHPMPPPPSSYPYYGSRPPPKVNPMIHYTRYEDNYRYGI